MEIVEIIGLVSYHVTDTRRLNYQYARYTVLELSVGSWKMQYRPNKHGRLERPYINKSRTECTLAV